MDILRKNIVSIIFGLIALAAVIALAWPIGGMYSDEQSKLETQKKDFDTAMGLKRSPRTVPVMVNTGPQQPLDRFPSEPVIRQGEAARKAVQVQSQRLLDAVVEVNKHVPLLSPELMPNPGDKKFEFRSLYWAIVGPGGQLEKTLQSTTPPTDEEINARASDLWNSDYLPKIFYVEGKPQNQELVKQNFDQAKAALPLQMRQERADKYKMYLDPGAISSSPYLDPQHDSAPTADQIWYAQVALWVEEDVANALASANSAAVNVMTAPVKQLVKLEVPEDFNIYVLPEGRGAGGSASPSGSSEGANTATVQPDERDFARSPTGRVSNSMYDVVHFTLVLNVDAGKLPQIIQELERKRLVTVFQVDAASFDSVNALENGYVFGAEPIAQVTLKCESLFLRNWTEPLMPPDVKQRLGINATKQSSRR